MFNGKEEIKSVPTFSCETCLFKCSKKSNYAKHLTTAKHKNLTNITEKNKKMPEHICSVCDKEYKSRVGLWYHKKTCEKENTVVMNKGDNPIELTFLTNLLLEVVKNNSELMKHNQEINKQNILNNNYHIFYNHYYHTNYFYINLLHHIFYIIF